MPVPQPPIASLLAWLAVSVLLLAGAPAQRPAAGVGGVPQRPAVANGCAEAAAALGLALAPDSAPLPQPKAREALEAPFAAHGVVSGSRFRCRWAQYPAGPAVVLRRSLVGLIELRL